MTAPSIDRCPTCRQALLRCDVPWPPSLRDVEQVRCQLPRGHRSEDHWHPALWPGTPDLLWFTDERERCGYRTPTPTPTPPPTGPGF